MRSLPRPTTTALATALVPLLLVGALPCRADEGGAPPPPTPVDRGESDGADEDDDVTRTALHVGAVAVGGALGAAAGFSVGAALAGGVYPLARREPPIAEGLTVAIGTPVVLTIAGAGLGALLSPVVLGEPLSVAGGLGATGGATVAGAAAAVPGAWLTWEATKALGAAIGEPSPEGCILSMVGLSAALSVMFGGFCAGAACGGAGGGAGAAFLDVPADAPASPPVPVPVPVPAPPAPPAPQQEIAPPVAAERPAPAPPLAY
ncbi:MAG: hypothetical protein HYS27_01005 [Deltaproteobacteria bacterium]|nr:hypothetical protein [Deltaproteobacteria bacterium]